MAKDTQNSIISSIVLNEDIAYTHAIFTQCFLPIRGAKTLSFEVSNGKTLLCIDAGKLINPSKPGESEQRFIPSGAKARLLLTYINDQAIRYKSPIISLGKSMRKFMEDSGVPAGGPNGKEIQDQLKNLSCARIMLGMWKEDTAIQKNMLIAGGMSFWLEKDKRQGTLWQPEMELSAEYYDVLKEHRVPCQFKTLVALQASPRAMDIYVWLSYRLCRVKMPTKIRFADLQPMFGQGVTGLPKFKQLFKASLKQVKEYYPEANFELGREYITLLPSPSPIGVKYHRVSAPQIMVDAKTLPEQNEQEKQRDALAKRLESDFGIAEHKAQELTALYSYEHILSKLNLLADYLNSGKEIKNMAATAISAICTWNAPTTSKEKILEELNRQEQEIAEDNPVWGYVRKSLREFCGDATYSSWLSKLEFESIEGRIIRLAVPTRFIKEWIETRLHHHVERAVNKNMPFIREIIYSVQ